MSMLTLICTDIVLWRIRKLHISKALA